jgi:tryptophanyl-tRNA synthetase
MYTDPGHLRASDPGRVEGNVVFAYLDAFDADVAAVEELKQAYRRGGLGDAVLKRGVVGVLAALVAPMRERRAELAADRRRLREILRDGIERARADSGAVLRDVRGVFSLAA